MYIMCRFCHLHNHSYYSLLDGLPSVKDMVEHAKKLNQKYLAITDHGNIYNLHDFIKYTKEYDINPVIGCEFYYHPKEYRIRESYHLLVIAQNDEGLKSLYKLITKSSHQFYEKPKITKQDLFEHSRGLLVTTGCIASHFNKLIIEDKIDLLMKEFDDFYSVFGKNLLIEFQDHGLKSQKKVNQFWLSFLRKNRNLIGIATNDSHYLEKSDAIIHDILLGIQSGKTINDEKRLRFTDDNNNLLSEFYMKSYEEMLSIDIFRENADLLHNTVEVAEMCKYSEFDFSGKVKYPKYHSSKGDIVEEFKQIVHQKARKVLGNEKYNLYLERLNNEVDVIVRLGFAPYFMIVSDIVNKSKEQGILVGPGRGSAAGSLVSYVLGITHIDPVRYNLLFDRFINSERVSPPDIDIDFEDRRRGDVIDYIKNTYGEDKTANIVTFSRMHLKMAVRDILRFYGVSAQDINNFSKDVLDHIDDVLDIDKNDFVKRKFESYVSRDSRFKDAVDKSRYFIDKVRQVGVHASGIVVADRDITEIMGLAVVSSGGERTIVTSYDMKGIESLGLLKVDILGLRTLSVIKDCLEDIKRYYGVDIDIYDIAKEPNDPEVFRLFSKGYTTGVFQFESDGMRKYLIEMQPDRIEDIIALNALYRPGPLQYIDTYIRRKKGLEKYEYYDDRLSSVLEETYGIIVYQEQIMQIVQIIAGYSLAKADLMRRAIGKKVKEIIDKERDEFIENAVNNGVSRDTAVKIYEDIEKFADYGFNKSHAAAYSILAYITAWIKVKYPLIFYKNLLNSYEGDIEKIKYVIKMAYKEMGLVIDRPSLARGNKHFDLDLDKNKIYYGLYYIKDTRKESIDNYLKNVSGYSDESVFLTNAVGEVDSATFDGLFWSGAIRDAEYRSEENYKDIKNAFDYYSKSSKKHVNNNEVNLFSNLFDLVSSKKHIDFRFKNVDNINKNAIIDKEIYYCGYSYFLMNMFLSKVGYVFDFDSMTYLRDDKFSGEMIGYLYQVNERTSKNKKRYISIEVLDGFGNKKYLLCFDEGKIDVIKNKLNEIVCLNVKRESNGTFGQLICNDVSDVSKDVVDRVISLINQGKVNKNNKEDIYKDRMSSDQYERSSKHESEVKVLSNVEMHESKQEARENSIDISDLTYNHSFLFFKEKDDKKISSIVDYALEEMNITDEQLVSDIKHNVYSMLYGKMNVDFINEENYKYYINIMYFMYRYFFSKNDYNYLLRINQVLSYIILHYISYFGDLDKAYKEKVKKIYIEYNEKIRKEFF
ncbi:MAG: DNA polymerase III subunit alpha [Candidatus Methanomethylicia archaeon]